MPLVTGYKVYWRSVPYGSSLPAGRDRSLWKFLAGLTPLGADPTATLPLKPSEDVYFAATLVFDSGFETDFVSESALIFQGCRILADPPSNNIRRIENSDATTRVESARQRPAHRRCHEREPDYHGSSASRRAERFMILPVAAPARGPSNGRDGREWGGGG